MANRKPNILILGVQVPFTRGGAELLVERLRDELTARGCCTDIVQLPFNALPKSALVQQISMWRALDLSTFAGRPVDLVIATKFPSYAVSHPKKVVWMVHQHRQLYELYGTRFGDFGSDPDDEGLRRLVVQADLVSLKEAAKIYTISPNVRDRLQLYLGIDSTSLPPPPPLAGRYRHGEKGSYILSVGRLCSIKRIDLIIRSLATIHHTLTLKVVGSPDEPAIERYLRSEVDKHHLWERVEFLGRVADEELLRLFADCFAVYYAPFDEDYGFVTLEALASGKPIVTASDSGSTLEFVRDEQNGLIAEPSEEGIAEAFNRLYRDDALYEQIAAGARSSGASGDWNTICDSLLSPLSEAEGSSELISRAAR